MCVLYILRVLFNFQVAHLCFTALDFLSHFFFLSFAWILIQGFEHIPDPGRNSVCAATFFKYICNYIRVQQEICSCSKIDIAWFASGKSTCAIVTLANWDWFKQWQDKVSRKSCGSRVGNDPGLFSITNVDRFFMVLG